MYFESLPGHFVTGSLYRPTGPRQAPGVLSPHGHWPDGRFQDVARPSAAQQLASGAERFDNGARHPLQARAVQLARMGCVVFHYDMVGYADSVQIPQDIAHRPRGRTRPVPTTGCSSAPRGAAAQLDHGPADLELRPRARLPQPLADVDPARIAVTGASGGGTQTFILGAIDDGPAVAFPAVMVSTRCRAAARARTPLLRIGTGNVEFAALFAPKPLGMTAADDWTKEMATEGFPELKQHYELLGARDKVQLFPFLQFGHNYNHVSRAAMYGWLNRHLGLGQDEPVLEQRLRAAHARRG